MDDELLNHIIGADLPEEKLLEGILPVEVRLLNKLTKNFNLDNNTRLDIIRALFRFKRLLLHYVVLWTRTQDGLSPVEKIDALKAFGQIQHNLNRDSRSCFSSNHFFHPIRFLLFKCQKRNVPAKNQGKYLYWILSFPIIPEKTIKSVLENEIWTGNLPHIYMFMLSGVISRALINQKSHKSICQKHRVFLKELNVPKAERQWFIKRLSGSYGSRQ